MLQVWMKKKLFSFTKINKNVIAIAYSPSGVFEFENFAHGTKGVMDAVVHATSKGTTSIIGK